MNATDRSQGRQQSRRPGDGVRRGTGRDREEWFAVLDAWGAAGRPYREIADWLTGEHDLSNWWAQKLIVEYEEARGLRAPGVRRDGRFEVGASKTVGAPVERVIAAFTDAGLRERWLPGAVLRERAPSSESKLRFDWQVGTSRLVVEVNAIAEGRSQVTVLHERLPDAGSAQEMRSYWREHLAALKAVIESERPR